MSDYRPEIETLEEWNESIAACGCCAMPSCPVPDDAYESVTSAAIAEGTISGGFINDGKLYARRFRSYINPAPVTEDSTDYWEWTGFGFTRIWTGEPAGGEYESSNISYTGEALRNEVLVPPIYTHVYGRNTCSEQLVEYQLSCTGSQVKTRTEKTGFTLDGSSFHVETTYLEVTTTSEVSGEETEEHIAWVAEWTDEATWQAAHDLWDVAHGEWQTATDQYASDYADYIASEDYTDWQDAWSTWDAGGQIGDEPVAPTPPEEFTDPEPPEPPAEPMEVYPPCTWKRIIHYETYAYEYGGGGFRLVPTTEENPNPEIIDGDPTYYTEPDGSFSAYTYEEVDVIEYADVLAAAQAGLAAVDYDGCALQDPLLVSRSSLMLSTPEADTDEISISLIQPRFRWVIPVVGTMNDPDAEIPDPLPEGVTEEEWWADHQVDMRWQGSYFKITWDILEEPDGWDNTINDPDAELPEELPEGVTEEEWWEDHQVPDPDAPHRSYFLTDQTWVWSGPGPEDADDPSWKSGWYEIPPPEAPGSRRVVNIRFECYGPTPYGNKPQITGEAVDLPPPPP